MPKIEIPHAADFATLAELLNEAAPAAGDALEIVVTPETFLRVDGLAFLVASCLEMQQRGIEIKLEGDPGICHYLQRMDFHAHLGLTEASANRRPSQGRFIPVMLIREHKDVMRANDNICDLMLRQFDDAKQFVPAMEWAVNELIDNIIIHAESPVPGVVCAQVYPKINRLEIAICDMGRGIRDSLATGHTIASDQDALALAMQRGVTRDSSVGQGNGMAGSLEICRVNQGDFELWSGASLYTMKHGEEEHYQPIPAVQGTGLRLRMQTNQPVDLTETWIAGGDWSYIDATAQQLGEGDGIDIAAECANTGSRPPAKYLRRKLVALLPEMEDPLQLDFSNVPSASSSFLDELLGRLALEFGPDILQTQVQLKGMTDTIRKMANVVIAQRTGEIELETTPNQTQNDPPPPEDSAPHTRNGWLVQTPHAESTTCFSVDLPLELSMLGGLEVGDGLALTTTDGDVFCFARLFRKRGLADSTTLYFDGVVPVDPPVPWQTLQLNAGTANAPIVRQQWPIFEKALITATTLGAFSELPRIQGDTRFEQAYIRDLLQVATIDDLLGPAGGPEEEVVGMGVRDRYLVGRLAPLDPNQMDNIDSLQGNTAPDEEDLVENAEDLVPLEEAGEGRKGRKGARRSLPGEEFSRTRGASNPDDGDSSQVDASSNQSFAPSSAGLTFCIDADVRELAVELRWGRYERNYDHDHYLERTRRNPETGEQETTRVKEKVWQRVPSGGVVALPITEGTIAPVSCDLECPEVLLQGTVRPPLPSGDRIVTLFLVNAQEVPDTNKDAAWVMQPEIIVRDPQGAPIFHRRPILKGIESDQERESLEMIYRNQVEFAVGHSISVHVSTLPDQPERATEVRTTVLPHYEVPVTETPGLNPEDRPAMQRMVSEGFLDMENLADLDRASLLAGLAILADDYADWIQEQQQRIGKDVMGHDDAAKQSIRNCEEILARLRDGMEVLNSNDDALAAFRFANRAMAAQRIHSIYALKRRRGETIELADLEVRKNRSWRPFQLAFLLLSIPAMADPKHKDRTQPIDAFADLIWFPTGGGKTEAYLGVAAFTMAIRRLQGDLGGLDSSRGLAVIMRYTLRLLTLQQFQRATTLLCAMETMRRQDKKSWGDAPFTIGLWVGRKVTPNNTEASHFSIQAERDGKKPKSSSPAQLTSCPWCGAEIAPGRDIDVRRRGKDVGRTVVFCGDKLGGCDFSRANSPEIGLPVVVVDEEIYHRPPTMLIGTVDKFALMAWRGEVRTLFGRVDQECSRHGLLWPEADCTGLHRASGRLPSTTALDVRNIRPPDLIIQDEFHLISGPLGTMVGLYETAIDQLATWNYDDAKIHPKVIASTATVRKAAEQVNGVFLRRVSIFPPSGFDIEDNFFSVQRPIEDVPGRRYLGICAPGSARPAVLIKVYTALLTAAQNLFEHFGKPADPFMTLVGYFNSLRELGGMKRLAEDDVQTRAYKVQMSSVNRPGLAQRSVKNINELTSRVSSKDIPKRLDELELPFKASNNAETGLFESNWEKGETQAVDVVLATNMLSVGVDINRLGLMAVNGQPKTTAEYIQATSRVGREFPGLVCTVLTWSRPRDLSHYESFEHYHATFYKHVEAQSVTPFALRALDRGLTGTLLSWLRLSSDQFNSNLAAGLMESLAIPEVEQLRQIFPERALHVTGNTTIENHTEGMVNERLDEWHKEASRGGRNLGYEQKRGQGDVAALLEKPGLKAWGTFTVPMSLREVEPNVRLVLDEHAAASEEPPWEARPVDPQDTEEDA